MAPSTSDSGPDAAKADATPPTGPVGGDRPVEIHVPAKYVKGTPAPLVLLLHGYGVSGDLQEVYFKLAVESDARGFLYAHPDGTIDAKSS